MNSTTDIAHLSPSATARQSGNLFQRLVFQSLARMKRGQLHFRLPDGSLHILGQSADSHWHDGSRNPEALAIPETAAIHVHRDCFFERCALYGDIGFAESYIDGDWDSPDIRAVIAWFILNLDSAPTVSGSRARALGVNLLRAGNRLRHLFRPNSQSTAARNIADHYDLSNVFFQTWLDDSMMYSSARWKRTDDSLEEAQITKNEALCKKLQLSATDHVLEIGTGWGSWSIHAACHYDCRITTLTLSREQFELAQKRVAEARLENRIDVRLQDYRDLPQGETYDKIVSIEMLEAVGHRYLRQWCEIVSRALKPDGLMALQFITCPDNRYHQFRRGVDFIQKHIFPGSLLLSVNRLNQLLAETGGFVLHNLEDMGLDYARTLREWRLRFQAQSSNLERQGFDHRFQRKWTYYLEYCEAAFAMRNISVVQTVHTRPNNLRLD